jgi:hypothetical protein
MKIVNYNLFDYCRKRNKNHEKIIKLMEQYVSKNIKNAMKPGVLFFEMLFFLSCFVYVF